MPMRNRPLRCSFMVSGGALLLVAGVAVGATKTVQVGPGGSLTFSPVTVTVTVGDTVEWQWNSGPPHTTTRAQAPETWDSGVASAPKTFSHTFTHAGMFPYVCTLHQALGMRGTVVVRGSSTTTTTTPGATNTTLPLSCETMESCRADLMAALPTAHTATNGKERRVDLLVQRLARRAGHQIDRAGATTGSRQAHALDKARRTLEQLRTVVDKAAAKGILGAPVGPIDAVIGSLLALAQPAWDTTQGRSRERGKSRLTRSPCRVRGGAPRQTLEASLHHAQGDLVPPAPRSVA